MPLHYKTKEAAVKKHGQLTGEELRKALLADRNNYEAEEVEEILTAITKAQETAAAGPATPPKSKVTPGEAVQATGERTPTDPNGAIRDMLRQFDYDSLRGKSFRDYCLFVQSLVQEHKYDFEVYQVEVARRERYRGVKDSPVDTIGFRIINNRPIMKTRIPVKHALANNGRVVPFKDEDGQDLPEFETLGCQLDHNGKNGRYYLLKK